MVEVVSIIINVFNGARYIEDAILSALNQTFANCEVFVFDNCSNDQTENICKKYKANIKYYKNNKTVPLYEARNKAIDFVTGTHIAFLDSDDIWVKDKIQKQINKSREYPNAIIYGAFEFIDNNGKLIMGKNIVRPYKSYNITKNLLVLNKISIGSALIPANIFKLYKFNEKMNLLGDFRLWFELSKNYKFIGLEDTLELSRDHDYNLSKDNQKLWRKEARFFVWENLKFNNIVLFPYLIFFLLKFEIIRFKKF